MRTGRLLCPSVQVARQRDRQKKALADDCIGQPLCNMLAQLGNGPVEALFFVPNKEGKSC
jgi:hypothetical protein